MLAFHQKASSAERPGAETFPPGPVLRQAALPLCVCEQRFAGFKQTSFGSFPKDLYLLVFLLYAWEIFLHGIKSQFWAFFSW